MTLYDKNEKAAPPETLGERFAAARKIKGLTQDDLAKYLDVTPQAISKWENNLSCPDILLLPKISEILGISIEELLTGSANKETVKPKITVTDAMNTLCLNIFLKSAPQSIVISLSSGEGFP